MRSGVITWRANPIVPAHKPLLSHCYPHLSPLLCISRQLGMRGGCCISNYRHMYHSLITIGLFTLPIYSSTHCMTLWLDQQFHRWTALSENNHAHLFEALKWNLKIKHHIYLLAVLSLINHYHMSTVKTPQQPVSREWPCMESKNSTSLLCLFTVLVCE